MTTKDDWSGKRVSLAHGAGGRAMRELITGLIAPAFDNGWLAPLEDQARFPYALLPAGAELAFTTDSYVVSPLTFAGGDIGTLAVCGTVNDLAVGGAVPRWLSCALIMEEGLPFDTLRMVLASMARCAREAGVAIVTGDTKVVERGAADGLFVNTAGIGTIPPGRRTGAREVRAGDRLIVNGELGDHGVAVLAARNDMALEIPVRSDCAPLNGLVEAMFAATPRLRWLRDCTRGGLATVANEFAAESRLQVRLDEAALPVGAAGGHEDYRDMARAFVAAHIFGQFEPVHAGHLDVEQGERDIVDQQQFQRFLARTGLQTDQPVALEQRFERQQIFLKVVDQQAI